MKVKIVYLLFFVTGLIAFNPVTAQVKSSRIIHRANLLQEDGLPASPIEAVE